MVEDAKPKRVRRFGSSKEKSKLMIRLGGLIFMAMIMGIWAVFALIDHTEKSVVRHKPARRVATAVLKLDDARAALQSDDPVQREGATIGYADALVREPPPPRRWGASNRPTVCDHF